MLKTSCLVGAVLAGTLSAPAQAAGLAGKWYEQTGSAPYITFYPAGSDYSASLGDTQGVVGAGNANTSPGHYVTTLNDLAATAAAIHFRTVTTIYAADNHIIGTAQSTCDLTPAPDGARLTGTCRNSTFGAPERSAPMTLYRRD